jgi:hypothetical protein
MKKDQILRVLAADIRNAGSLRAWGRAHNLSAGYVSGVMCGRYPPAKSILAALGLERVRTDIVRKRA